MLSAGHLLYINLAEGRKTGRKLLMKTFTKTLYKFNLQFFAEEEAPETTEVEDVAEPEARHYTQADIDKMIAKRLKQQEAKLQKQFEAEKAEEKRLAEMDAQQRAEEEHKKRLAQLEAREAKIKLAEDRIECEKILRERGLAVDMAQFLLTNDAETTLANINSFEKAFKEAVQKEVNEKIKGTTPASGSPEGNKGGMTKEQFKALPLMEKNKLYLSDPETYKKLIK